ncbi:MAG: hypothetical protein A2172_05355 [Candidatus Woykebacteria bacterium RBG_13_40_15]|uniref:Uncharacterized protein n=1 Tax=Candidatus Woykebacteria bacterium RBG_13_40_15 TaxID=1802593 RepID=A0A1G1W880_9BACT|nr:MAG: hypothetical protein A2172_05355 [Candidatus Woykebacteria bacterium RBG_13_40_15]
MSKVASKEEVLRFGKLVEGLDNTAPNKPREPSRESIKDYYQNKIKELESQKKILTICLVSAVILLLLLIYNPDIARTIKGLAAYIDWYLRESPDSGALDY